MNPILRKVLHAEAQAIAIYSAEIFWTRNPGRRAALQRIHDEEVGHHDGLTPYSLPLRTSLDFDRFSGLILGTLLSLLPWRAFCAVQSWAENEAAKIYAGAVKSLNDRTDDLPSGLLAKLREAEEQEKAHSRFFSGPAREL